MNPNIPIERPYPQPPRRMETANTLPQSPPTLEEIHRSLRDAADGLYGNNATLSDLKDRLFGADPIGGNIVEAGIEPFGEIGGIMATTRALCDLLRKQRAIIDRLVAI